MLLDAHRRDGSPDARARARHLICELLAAAGGTLVRTTRLGAAFYVAHVYHCQTEHENLSNFAIAGSRTSAVVELLEALVAELARENMREGKLAVLTVAAGPLVDAAYRLTSAVELERRSARTRSIVRAADFARRHPVAALRQLIVEHGRRWDPVAAAGEMSIYANLDRDDEMAWAGDRADWLARQEDEAA